MPIKDSVVCRMIESEVKWHKNEWSEYLHYSNCHCDRPNV